MDNEKLLWSNDKEAVLEEIQLLKDANVTGVCFYTDGGHRTIDKHPRSGYGIHAYFYNEDKPEKVGVYKLDLPTKDGWKVKKDLDREKVVNIARVLSCYGFIGTVTSPVAELRAFLQAMDLYLNFKLYEFIPKFTLHSDCEYVIKGINEYLSIWISKGWKKSNGAQVENITYWKKTKEIIDKLNELGVDYTFAHIKGHAQDTGNNISDQLATMGLRSSHPLNHIWQDKDEYFKNVVELHPLLLESKLLSYPGVDSIKLTPDDKQVCFLYNNISTTSNINEVGRNFADSAIGLVVLDEPDPFVEQNMEICDELDRITGVSTPKATNLSIATRGKYQLELDVKNIKNLKIDVDLKDTKVMTTDDKVPITVLNPPRNSLSTLAALSNLGAIAKAFLNNEDDNFRMVDITDLLFDKSVNGKGVTKYKFKVNESLSVDVDVPVTSASGDFTVKTPLTFGLDLPKRRVFSNITTLSPIIQVFSWYENEIISYYATVIRVDGAVCVWCAEHTNFINKRGLNK